MNTVIAELASWSMKIAAAGVWPHTGFNGAPLERGTERFLRKGRELALGWKILVKLYCSRVYLVLILLIREWVITDKIWYAIRVPNNA